LVFEIQKGILLYSCHIVRKFLNIDTEHNKTTKSKCGGETPVIMLISTALLLDSNIRNSVCTPSKLPCRRVVEGKNATLMEITNFLRFIYEYVYFSFLNEFFYEPCVYCVA
jgi:hypothetical protein